MLKTLTRIGLTICVIICLTIVVAAVGLVLVGFYLSPQDQLQKADAIVVISGGETQTRTVEGIKLYQTGFAPWLIFSGDALDPTSPSNAQVMKNLAINSYQVPEKDVLIDEQSTNTYDNAVRLKNIFSEHNIKSIILVTSPYHQRRSKMTFQYVLGPDFNIINHSSTDEFWRKLAWWQNDQALSLTFSEIWKIFYIKMTGRYS
jgi:uncharacterized SAM-binding protein YcdF (DUF218 family)